MNLKKFGKAFTSKFVGTGPSSYKKIIYLAAVSQRLRNTGLKGCFEIKISCNKTVLKHNLLQHEGCKTRTP